MRENNFNWSVVVFMLTVEREYYSIQAPLIYKSPVEDLDDNNMAKLIVYLVNLFEKEKIKVYLKVKLAELLVQNSRYSII